MNPYQVKQWLRQGIAAAKAGNDEQARKLLLKVVDVDEYNEQAWVWLSSVVGSDEDREICLENVLAINPDNHLAQAGLAYLHSRQATAAPPPEPEVQQRAEPAPAPESKPTPQPPASRPAPQPPVAAAPEQPDAESLDARLAAATTLSPKPEAAPGPQTTPDPQGTSEEQAPPKKKEKPQGAKKQRLARRLIGQFWPVAPLLAAALVVGAMAFLIIQFKPFDPSARNYANAMRPLLETYTAWWDDGPYGTLVSELTRLCGPGANGWHNRDVLLNCSRYPSVDCAHLAAHCGGDVEAMRRRVARLAREAKQTGTELLSDIEAIVPPPEIAQHHAHFVGCLETRLVDADWVEYAASGEAAPRPDTLPICQMFPNAEQALLQYVNGR